MLKQAAAGRGEWGRAAAPRGHRGHWLVARLSVKEKTDVGLLVAFRPSIKGRPEQRPWPATVDRPSMETTSRRRYQPSEEAPWKGARPLLDEPQSSSSQ